MFLSLWISLCRLVTTAHERKRLHRSAWGGTDSATQSDMEGWRSQPRCTHWGKISKHISFDQKETVMFLIDDQFECHLVQDCAVQVQPIHANFRIWYVLDTPISFISAVGWADTLSGPLMSLRPARNMSLRRWLLVACFSSVKNYNVSGPHLFPSFTTHAKKIPLLPLGRSYTEPKKSLCNRRSEN